MVQEQQYYQPRAVVISQLTRRMDGVRTFLIIYHVFVLFICFAGLICGLFFFVLHSDYTIYRIWGSLVITGVLLFFAHSVVSLIGAVRENVRLLLAAFIVGIVVVLFEIGVVAWGFIGIGYDMAAFTMRFFAGFFTVEAIIRAIGVVFTGMLWSAILNQKPTIVVGQPMMVGGGQPPQLPPDQVIVESQPHQPPAPPPTPTPMKGPAPIQH